MPIQRHLHHQRDLPDRLCWRRTAGSDGVQQTFDGYLVGADRTKDLCVLRINAPKVHIARTTP